jgi:DNA-binding transcriptional LysR family regulator
LRIGCEFMMGGEDPTAHQLRLLLTLAEELHFGRAASRLYLTQPALSQQIRSLEQRMGVRLFARTSRRVELTEAGRELLPLVKNVVGAADELRAAAVRSATGSGRLRLGVCESFGSLPVTRAVIAEVASSYPDLGPDMLIADSFVEQLSMLKEGAIDAAFVYLPVPEGLRAQPLTAEPRLVCVSADDPLARRSSVLLADLAGHPVVGLAPETFPAAGGFWAVDPRPDGSAVRYTSHQVARLESVLSTVALGGPIAFVPSAAAELYPRQDLRYLPVDDLPGCEFGLVWHPADHHKPHLSALHEVTRRFRVSRTSSAVPRPAVERVREPAAGSASPR